METDPIRAPAPTRLRYFNFSSILTKTRIELRVLGFNKFMFLPKVHVLNLSGDRHIMQTPSPSFVRILG